jgi:hypothetical protein
MRGMAMVEGRLVALTIIGVGLLPTSASATCVCRCVNGEMQSICSNSIEVPPICPPTVCQIVPPSVAPVPTPMVPPIGATSCEPEQVLNPHTQQYEWRTICR